MIAIASARPGLFARLALAILAATGIASCGSGAVGQPPVSDSARITILPSTATLYSGLPTTFQISGGTGAYIVSSSNQAIVPVSGTNQTGVLTIVPNNVIADTPVTITVRDTGTAPLATATLTVSPNTVNNNITVTPSGTQGGSCSPAVCSGSDAVVSVTISQGGIPLAARSVRFTVVSGDYRFITSPLDAGVETLANSVDVVTDELGRARSRIRILTDAPNQTALLQVMDLGTGAFQRTTFLISQSTGTSPGFFVTPTSLTFSGRFQGECSNNVTATFFIFGGSPPYTVLNSATSAFFTSAEVVSESGGSVGVTSRGVCASSLPIVVRDTAGRTATVTVSNVEGSANVSDVVVAPDTVTLTDCNTAANVTIAGGTGSYSLGNGSGALNLTLSANSLTIRRKNPSPAPASPITIGVSDGRTTDNVTVNLTGEAAGACPTPAITATPSSVTLATCSTVQSVALSGGIGTYSASPNDAAITVNVSGSTLTVQRTNPSPVFTSGIVTVFSGSRTLDISVTGTGTGVAGQGNGSCP